MFNLLIKCSALAVFLSFVATPVSAVIVDGIDLRATMKQMRFEYNQAMKTTSVDVFNKHITQFKQQLTLAQKFKFPEEKVIKAQEGLNKVAAAITSIELPVSEENLKRAQERLVIIDQLREQYHDKKVSAWQRFWQALFAD